MFKLLLKLALHSLAAFGLLHVGLQIYYFCTNMEELENVTPREGVRKYYAFMAKTLK